jgi:hypothetical protein
LLTLVGAAFIAALIGMLVFVLQGGIVFGYAGGYPIAPGVIFGISGYWLVTTGAPSLYVAVVAWGGLISMLVAGGLALNSAHRE